ncbi:MAG: hypothetical protein HEP71_34050 [Roseivirga sp.]|nr:hypothetical protein [Roseivirga sp.]
MKEYGTDELFGTVKQAPTELSKQQVMEMITVIPTLPPPGNSWFNINLNSIIMTTTVVAIISSAVIYFTTPVTPSELPGQEPESPAVITALAEDPSPEKTSEDSVPVDPISSIPGPKSDSALNASAEPDPLPLSSTARPQSQVVPSPKPREVPQVVDRSASGETVKAVPKVSDVNSAVQKSSMPSSPAPSRAISDRPVSAQSKPAVSPEPESVPLGKLKRTLIRELYNDQITGSKKPFMTVIEFKGKDVIVNFKPLDKDYRSKYEGILRKHAVTPGPNKRIVVDADFIMVGNFTQSGFLGSAKGKRMRISFADSTVFFDDMHKNPEDGMQGRITYTPSRGYKESILVLGNDGTDISGSSPLFPKSDNKGGLMISTEGKVQDAEANTRSASLLTSDGSDEALFNDNTHEIGNAVTMTNTKVDSPPVELNSLRINKLKRELYRYLVQDDQVRSNKADVNMVIGTGPFSVNGNNPFSPAMEARYKALFRSHGVQLRSKLKILMSTDFIFVGEFGEDNFNGSVQGVLVKEKIVGSIFEEELGQYSLFGNSNKTDDVATENRSVKSFDRIKVSGLAKVFYSQGPEKELRLEVSGVPLEDIFTEVKDGELHVFSHPDKAFKEESIKVYVYSPSIKSIEVDDAAEFIGQTQIIEDELQVSSLGDGSVELGVDVGRLHIIMDGGDIDLEGKAVMQRTDLLNDANSGTLYQRGLNVLKNWEPEEKRSNSGKDLEKLKEDLIEKLLDDGFMESLRDKVTISFSTTGLEIGNTQIPGDKLIGYLKLFKEYDFFLRNQRKVFLGRTFIVIADKNKDGFEFEMKGTKLAFNTQDSWEKLEEDIFKRD